MASIRKPLQGTLNIIHFNWPFYLLSFITVITLVVSNDILHIAVFQLLALLIGLQVSVSLLVSLYIYDLSGFYKLGWLNARISPGDQKIININAGFDEISELLIEKFPDSTLTVFDFYDPLLHTEASINRARKAYPPYPGTVSIKTTSILLDKPADTILLIFAAHEIRNSQERIDFFRILKRNLKLNGEIILVEHLQNIPNFLAYNVGFFHFVSHKAWCNLFQAVGFQVTETKINPFVTMFSLKNNGN